MRRQKTVTHAAEPRPLEVVPEPDDSILHHMPDSEFATPSIDTPNKERRPSLLSIEFVLRLLGGMAAGVGGYYAGVELAVLGGRPELFLVYGLAIGFLAAALGLLITPYLTTRPMRWIRRRVQQAPAHELVAGLIGLLVGLIFSALAAIPFSMLPSPLKEVVPVLAMVVFAYLGVTSMVMRKRDLLSFVGSVRGGGERGATREKNAAAWSTKVLLDTSAIIDGRIADVSQTGFISGPMVVPRFVLNELHHIADSPDALRRNRGRRGLDILGKLQRESLVPVEMVETDVNGLEVDAKLVKMAKQYGCAILTNDYNLNRVAALQGVRVLNINELANAIKAVVLPGEEMSVRVIQEGKEAGQGVGYLDDGTMVVIEGGRRFLGGQINVVVTRVLQTVAGRMIFAHPRD